MALWAVFTFDAEECEPGTVFTYAVNADLAKENVRQYLRRTYEGGLPSITKASPVPYVTFEVDAEGQIFGVKGSRR